MTEAKPPRRRRGHASRTPDAARRGAPTRARRLALRVLERVEQTGAYADLALHAALGGSDLVVGDRALATELVYGTLRWRGRLDFLLGHVLDHPLDDIEPSVRCLLRLGAYQLAFLDSVPDAVAVDQSVRAAHATGQGRAAGLVNASLRRLAREQGTIALPALETDPEDHLVHALSIPRWLARRWLAQLGPEEAAALATASNQVPPLTVRVNPLRSDRAALLAELSERFPEARETAFASRGIVLGLGGRPGEDAAFREGRFTVQDEGSQLAVDVLDPQPHERVLDLCAAPGAKTTGIAEILGPRGEVVAVDRHEKRLNLLGRDARRLGLANITTRHADGIELSSQIAPDGGFDRVLVDAPCSGLGTLRRNPDARWRTGPEEPAKLQEPQLALLQRGARALRPGGTLVYSTCTLATEENEGVIERFLQGSPEFRLVSPALREERLLPLVDPVGALRCWPHRHGTDGFFICRLERPA